MALNSENDMIMPVTPMYGNGGNGGGFGDFGGNSGWWIILLFLLLGNGWNNGSNNGGGGNWNSGGFAPYMMGADFGIQRGFDQAAIMSGINGIAGDMCNGFAGVQQSLCNGFAGVNQNVSNGFAGAEIAANGRQMANMNQAFGMQTAMSQGFNQLASQFADCCCENRLGIENLKYTVATENCADRTLSMQNTRDIIDSQNRGTQAVLDKLCQLELDGVKAQVDAKNDRISELQTQLNMANLAASQTAQTAIIRDGQNQAVSSLVSELRSCPIPAQPVYGSQPIFTCPNNNNGCGCGCG